MGSRRGGGVGGWSRRGEGQMRGEGEEEGRGREGL